MPGIETKAGNGMALAMTDWLDVLSAAMPPAGVLLVGAGAGSSVWIRWLQSQPRPPVGVPVHLVEGDEQQYVHLRRHIGKIDGCTAWRDVVAAESGAVTFHRTNNPAESGLLSAQSLKPLWPNLTADGVVVDNATTLDALQAEIGERINWLLLDCLPAAALLQGGLQLLPQLDVVMVRVASDLLPDPLAQRQSVDQLLGEAGFRCVYGQPERHPALTHLLYVRDTARLRSVQRQTQDRLQELTEQLQAAQEEHATQKQAHEQALNVAQDAWVKERAELAVSLSAANQAAEQAKEQAVQWQEKLRLAQENALNDAEKSRAAQDAWVKEKTELVESLQATSALKDHVQQHVVQLEACKSSINDLEKSLRLNFGKDLGNAVMQIEAFVSIQSYLNTGEGISGFHGWPISPDLGLFLIERIRERRYDIVIEFGSGTSTALFAKVLQISQRGRGSSTQVKKGGREVRFVHSFEHDPVYLAKTRGMLEAQGLAEKVALHHASLVDWQDETGKYLYYDCDSELAALARQLRGKPRRILVLVDGPPGATCANARYPAVPQVFKHLNRHEVDLVLDDANRPEEKAVIELWRKFWKQRSIRMVEEDVPTEKGMYWARNWDNRS